MSVANGLFQILFEEFGRALADALMRWIMEKQLNVPEGVQRSPTLLRRWAADLLVANKEEVRKLYNAQFDPVFDAAVTVLRGE